MISIIQTGIPFIDQILGAGGLLLASFASIVSVANPFSTMPVFTSMTEDNTDEQRTAIAKKASMYMFIILSIFLLAGTYIQSFFGISLAGIRVAGGLIILHSAWAMLTPDRNPKKITEEGEESARQKGDISFSPLAMPMLSGPGSIAVVLGLASSSGSVIDFVVFIAAILLSAIVSYFILRIGPFSSKYIGPSGMNAITRLMGFIVMAIAVQFILSGIKDFFMI